MEKKSKSVDTKALSTRVYYTHKLIQIYDVCNMFKNLSTSSDEFKKEKEHLQALLEKVHKAQTSNDDQAFEEGILAEEELSRRQALDKDGHLKSDEELLSLINQARQKEKKEQLLQVLAFTNEENHMKGFQAFLKNQNIPDLKVFIEQEHGNPKKLREKLAQDFALFQVADPTNSLIDELRQPIAEQTSSLNFNYYYVKENPARNEEIKQDFNTNENCKKKFLKLMGYLLGLGEALKNNNLQTDTNAYEKVRELSGNSALSDETIKNIALKSYNAVCEGLWIYKNKVNPDHIAQKALYIQRNIAQWIKKLKMGSNYVPSLALLSVKEEKAYQAANEKEQEEINTKHISIHHKIPRKYHGIFKNPDDHFLLNHISNFEMIISGTLHNQKHINDEDEMIKLNSVKDSAILCVPTEDFDLKRAKEISMDIPEPEKLAELRPQKTTEDISERQTTPYSKDDTLSR